MRIGLAGFLLHTVRFGQLTLESSANECHRPTLP